MNQYIYQPRVKNTKKKYFKIVLVALIILVICALVFWVKNSSSQNLKSHESPDVEQITTPVQKEDKPIQQLPNIQSTIDDFIKNNPGDYGIKITDTNGKTLAEESGDKQYYTASIYKLFVAYVGYQKIDDGTYQASEPYLTGYTRGKCLDAMIRDSYSPCAEKMWNELGKAEVTKQMQDIGLKNTSLTGLNTTANDTAIILQKIANGQGLSQQSQTAFLNSMKDQDAKFRKGLPSGFAKATVFNKVGWNEDKEWHDAAIVGLPNGQKIIVCVLTSGVGYKTVSNLGTTIQNALE